MTVQQFSNWFLPHADCPEWLKTNNCWTHFSGWKCLIISDNRQLLSSVDAEVLKYHEWLEVLEHLWTFFADFAHIGAFMGWSTAVYRCNYLSRILDFPVKNDNFYRLSISEVKYHVGMDLQFCCSTWMFAVFWTGDMGHEWSILHSPQIMDEPWLPVMVNTKNTCDHC